MIEFTVLEAVLLVTVAMLALSYFQLDKEHKAFKRATAIIMLGLHQGKLKTVDVGDAITVETAE